jgi:hypothetical protein
LSNVTFDCLRKAAAAPASSSVEMPMTLTASCRSGATGARGIHFGPAGPHQLAQTLMISGFAQIGDCGNRPQIH